MVSNQNNGNRGGGNGGRPFFKRNPNGNNSQRRMKMNNFAGPNFHQPDANFHMQIPDDHGYVDFNDPTPSKANPNQQNAGMGNKGKPEKNRPQQMNMSGKQAHNGFNAGPGNVNRKWNADSNSNGTMFQPRNFRNPVRLPPNRVPPPPHAMGMRPPRPPHMNPARFNGRPPCPPMPGPPGMMPPRGPPMRHLRNGPGPIPMPLQPPPMGHRFPGPPQGRQMIPPNKVYNRKRPLPNDDGNTSPKKASKKTLKEILNQYPLDKPWVSDEIKAQHGIKESIENRLKGKRDDVLFAEFKVQRDKFVTMYEAAKLEFIGNSTTDKDIPSVKEKGENS